MDAAAAGAASWSGVPHSSQNFCPGSFDAPQAGQRPASEAPHSRQNFASGRFAAPQLEHFTNALPWSGRS